MLKNINDIVNLFQQVDDPRRIGDRKSGRLKDAYVLKLSGSIGLAYKVLSDVRKTQLASINRCMDTIDCSVHQKTWYKHRPPDSEMLTHLIPEKTGSS